jgi:hypothetical protein
MNRRLVLVPVVITLTGCAALGPVRPPAADSADPAVQAMAAAGEPGCRLAPEIEVARGLTLDEQRQARRPIRHPRIEIRSWGDSATLASARSEGFQGRAPAEVDGLSVREIRRAGDELLIYLGPVDIRDRDTIRDVLLAGGALLSEMPRDPGFAAFMADQLGDGVVTVPIGSGEGYIRQRHEIAPGVFPYEVRWQDGGSYFMLTTAAPSAAAAIDQARSVMC